MKICLFLRSSFSLLFFLTLLACQDHRNEPGVSRFRLKKTTIATTGYTTESVYNYNSAGKLENYLIKSNGAGGFNGAVIPAYDAQGRVRSINRQSYATGRLDLILDYAYDGNGNITTITEISTPLITPQQTGISLTQTTKLVYNADKLPTNITTVSASGNRTETVLYTYANGNVIKSERSFGAGTIPQVINFKHDDKPNPFYGLLINAPDPEAINRNNILYDGSERIYNSQGLLTNMNTNVNGAAIDKARYTYEYEAY